MKSLIQEISQMTAPADSTLDRESIKRFGKLRTHLFSITINSTAFTSIFLQIGLQKQVMYLHQLKSNIFDEEDDADQDII